jgi:hypothetical protein
LAANVSSAAAALANEVTPEHAQAC